MLSRRISQLAPPPRPVPLRLACRAMLGLAGGLGAVFMLVGMVFAWVLTTGFDPIGDLQLALKVETTQGVITRITETNTTENDVTVYRYDFSFRTPSEESFTGTGYIRGRRWSAEERVTIEYVPSNPAIARIQGTRRSMAPFWVILLVLIFPATGALLFFSATVGGWRQARLLRHGELSEAEIVSEEMTGTRINDVPVMAYVYEFPANDGESYLGRSKALPTGRVGDEEKEPVLYLPWNPRQSTLVDTLPMRHPLDVDEFGQWVAQGKAWPIVWVAVIWIGVVANAAYGLWRLFGSFIP